MRRSFLLIPALALAAPLALAGDWTPPAKTLKSLKKVTRTAHAVGQESSNQALAALYGRLFQLQDKRRDAELRLDSSIFTIDDLVEDYRALDRWVDNAELLKEIAGDRNHRRYPNITESAKLKILALVRKEMRVQKMAGLEIKKINRDIAAVEKLIKEHLDRPAR